MTTTEIEAVKEHFQIWSGGFEPESRWQIVVYCDYARDSRLDKDEVFRVLEEWMCGEDETWNDVEDE